MAYTPRQGLASIPIRIGSLRRGSGACVALPSRIFAAAYEQYGSVNFVLEIVGLEYREENGFIRIPFYLFARNKGPRFRRTTDARGETTGNNEFAQHRLIGEIL